ncbi:peptidoglycan DD-metalloendopeptidase family protein [Streptomyces monomycini]|uniref:peptidoglycan DD-metalloendopeptidase family protein n=1 Tax=Streptomyces monomycini TaxID=371720 RepID=UPI003557CFE5
MRQRTVFETVRAAVVRRPARGVRAVPTTGTRRSWVGPGSGRPAGSAVTGGAGGVRNGRVAHARRTAPTAARLLALCAAGTASAVLSAGAATVGVAFAGDVPPRPTEPSEPSKPSKRSEHHPTSAPGRSTGPDPSRPATPATGERAWPITGATGARPTVARGWEPPPAPWAPGHRGVDLLAAEDTTVRAAAPGRVLFAGKVAGRGVLSIEVAKSGHPPLRTTYEPVHPTVRKGDHVTAGQAVAKLGPGPFHCSAACLHWGLLRGKTYLDPLSLLPPAMLNPGPSRLLPVINVPEPRSESRHRDPPRPRQSRRTRSPQAGRIRGIRKRAPPLHQPAHRVLKLRPKPAPTPHAPRPTPSATR